MEDIYCLIIKQKSFPNNKVEKKYRQKNEQEKSDVFANAIKHDFRSKNPTTRWSDIIRLK